MNELLNRLLGSKLIVDLIKSDRPYAILFFIGILFSAFCFYVFVSTASNLPLRMERLEKAKIESMRAETNIEVLSSVIIAKGSRILGSGSLDINMSGSVLTEKATAITEEIFEQYEKLTTAQKKEWTEFSSGTTKVMKEIIKKSELFQITEAREIGELQHEQFLMTISKSGAVIGALLSFAGFVLWAATVSQKREKTGSSKKSVAS